MKFPFLVALAIFGSLLSAGCTSAPVTPAPIPDSVSSLTDVAPPLGTKLLHGQTVTFTGTAGYSLVSADSGQVVLAVQDQANKPLTTAQPSATVAKGSGQVTLSQSITLPDAGVTVVRVFFLLAPSGSSVTHAAEALTYQVQ
jgi:hypothetical protein